MLTYSLLAVVTHEPFLDVVGRALDETLTNFPAVWRDKQRLHSVKTHLIYQGTALLLRSSGVLSNRAALILAPAIDIMDVYMDDFLLPISGKHFMKNTDLSQGCERSLFFFYKFRIGCTCLDKKCASSAVQKNLFCDGSETSLDKFLHAILRNSTHRCFFQSKLKEDNPLLSQ